MTRQYTSTLVKDQPFIAQSDLTGRWYFVRSWRPDDLGNKVAHEKFDVTEAIEAIRVEAVDQALEEGRVQ